MSKPPDDRFQRLLAQQLEMNPRTWAALEQRGADEQSLLIVEFSFTAPSRKHATELVKTLRRRTTFSAEILREGPMRKRHWRVVGHTLPSTVSIAMLDAWVTFMVTLGAEHGASRFDGWGVRMHEDKRQGAGPDEGLDHGFGANAANGANGAQPAGD